MHQPISTDLDARLESWMPQTTLAHTGPTPGDLEMRINRPDSEPLCYARYTAPCTLQTIEPSALVSPVFSMQRPYLPSKEFSLLPSPYVPASYRLPEVRSRSAALQCTLPVRFDRSSPLPRSTAFSIRNHDASTGMSSSQQEDIIIVHSSPSLPLARHNHDMDYDRSTTNNRTPLDTTLHDSTVGKTSKRVPQACS